MVRTAFTMIELIFALVIMSIVFISLPMILINNADSMEDNLIQESIFLTSSKMSQILTYQWDERSSEVDTTVLSTSDVLDVTNGAALLDRNTEDYRIGHFREDKHRRMSPWGTPRTASVIGAENVGELNDIDDFDALVDSALININPGNNATSGGGYKKQYRADVSVLYIDDDNFLNGTTYASNSIDFILSNAAAAAVTTNLKMVEVSIDQQNPAGGWDQTLMLRSFVANIGETDYLKRRY